MSTRIQQFVSNVDREVYPILITQESNRGLIRTHMAIGGSDGAGNSLATVEAYTPETNTWAAVAPLPEAAMSPAAAAGPDGRIYAIGGMDGFKVLESVQVYTPGADTWTSAAPLPTGRVNLAAVLGPDGLIYAMGGIDNTGTLGLEVVTAYSAATGGWR